MHSRAEIAHHVLNLGPTKAEPILCVKITLAYFNPKNENTASSDEERKPPNAKI